MHDTHNGADLRTLHGALLDIVALMNGAERDDVLIREANIQLDRALFPLLVLVERFGPIGVVDLADRVGRDYTTVSRQLAKMESLDLIARIPNPQDKRIREAHIAPLGKTMAQSIDAARDKILRAGFSDWSGTDLAQLVALTVRLAQAMRKGQTAKG